MKKVLFIDRDGSLVMKPPIDCQVDSFEKLEYYPGVFQYLSRIVEELDYLLVMLINQDGVENNTFSEEPFWQVHNKIIQAFKNEGVLFTEVLLDKSFAHQELLIRKSVNGMLTHYIKENYDIVNSYVIGDRLTDLQLARNLGCKSIYLSKEKSNAAELTTQSWKDIYHYLQSKPRLLKIIRTTNETEITVVINLDGSGKSIISTGLGFFDHMLEQIAKHGLLDISIQVNGDLHIDEHHTIEDVAITLGEAFAQLLGQKKGIERYGFLLPMDDCLAQVAIDFGGRSWLQWEASFKREKIGDMPTEMFMHFFKSFCDNAKCNLNIKAEGENEHHKIESIFKAFAKSIKMAVAKTNNFSIPSTKGTL